MHVQDDRLFRERAFVGTESGRDDLAPLVKRLGEAPEHPRRDLRQQHQFMDQDARQEIAKAPPLSVGR